jgi:hypothetical protein
MEQSPYATKLDGGNGEWSSLGIGLLGGSV